MKSNATRFSHDLTGVRPVPEVVSSRDSADRLHVNINFVGYTQGTSEPVPEGGHTQVALKMRAWDAIAAVLDTAARLAAAHPEIIREVAHPWVLDETRYPLHHLQFALDPVRSGMTVDGYCTACIKPAVAEPETEDHGHVWVHVGAANHAEGGEFRKGTPPEIRCAWSACRYYGQPAEPSHVHRSPDGIEAPPGWKLVRDE